MIMGKEKAGEEKVHIIILYRGNLSGRGKRVFAEKGRGKGHFGEEKGCFEEENRGRNWDLEGDKLKNRWGIDGSWTGNQTRTERKSNEG